MSKFGRFQVSEAPSALKRWHFRTEPILQPMNWEPLNAVLDQEDLIAQGIDTSQLIPGAAQVDALGSCTANATMSALSHVLSVDSYLEFTKAVSYDDTKTIEEAAITFYHECTDETGVPADEWPPNDCGSTGPYIVQELETQGLISGDLIASGPDNICSLLQKGGLLVGQPFLNAWMQPDANGFIDGDGSYATLQAQLAQGVAGGHETYLCGLEKVEFHPNGTVDPSKTIIRFRNSWGSSWGDHGNYRAHLSTYVALGTYCDFRQLQP